MATRDSTVNYEETDTIADVNCKTWLDEYSDYFVLSGYWKNSIAIHVTV
jgi:hypothetical protein